MNERCPILHLIPYFTVFVFILFKSGGRIITVEGNGFLMVQNVSMVVLNVGKEQTVSLCESSMIKKRAKMMEAFSQI